MIVSFEGADCSGKGTQSRLLEKSLQKRGISVVRVEPTKESHPLGKRTIYSMLSSGSAKRNPNVFQVVQFLNRAYFQLFKLPKLLFEHDLIILDRWSLSGYVYGKCENVHPWLNELMYRGLKRPDLVVILSGNAYHRDESKDSYENDYALQTNVNLEYVEISDTPGHVLIHNMESIEKVHQQVFETIKDKIKRDE